MLARDILGAVSSGLILFLSCSLAGPASPPGSSLDVRLTADAVKKGSSYTRSDGVVDATMKACSSGRRSQNEPAVAVDPHSPNVVVAGSNDYCPTAVRDGSWAGFYRSTDGGATWSDSLVPGYPKDDSAAGLASPAKGNCVSAGDPTMTFDADGRLYYGFLCLGVSEDGETEGSVFVASYAGDAATYERTTLVSQGGPVVDTPAVTLNDVGLFMDKVNIAADQTGGPHNGTVYVAWAQFPETEGLFVLPDTILVSHSIDGGKTFSPPFVVTAPSHGVQFADLAVGPDGVVYLVFRDYLLTDSAKIWITRSTDGGSTFGPPVLVSTIVPFDSREFADDGSRDCGDGPYWCESRFTYARFDSQPAVAADKSGVHVVWNAELPNGQSKVFVSNSTDGIQWSADPATLDVNATGHQWMPDVASAGGILYAVFFDSRNDPAYSRMRPPGNTIQGINSGGAIDAFVGRSSDGGVTWTETRASSVSSNPNFETHGSRRLPFFGDYLYVSAVPGAANVVWTDSRDLVTGTDPRDPGNQDGFDVYQPCIYFPNDIWEATYRLPTADDPCLSAGGLDQNIYGRRVS